MVELVWLKRDFRAFDHAPLKTAIESGNPVVLLFLLEPMLLNHPKYSNRHFKFMLESIVDLNRVLKPYGSKVQILEVEALAFFKILKQEIGSFRILSHQETGVGSTFVRDLQIKKWCKQAQISWLEFKQQGVSRGRINRKNWKIEWDNFMEAKVQTPNLSQITIGEIPQTIRKKFSVLFELKEEHESMQEGGRTHAVDLLRSFLTTRYKGYSRNISKPATSRIHCSRLSTHIAWGTISVREIVQSIHKKVKSNPTNKRDLQNFKSRLYWHCHFIQKLESEPRIEFENHNPAYNAIRNELNEAYLQRFVEGKTGIPIIDANMRCLNATGYINFRMRAMLVSLWTHHLLQPWQAIAPHLANMFLDFEPGIHYPQLQMQAGTVGYHTIRTYNPTKQAQDHDKEAKFIKKWVPELTKLAPHLAIEPWKMTPMEALMEDFDLERDYYLPICNIEKEGRRARDLIHAVKQKSHTQYIASQISKIHVNQDGV